MGEHSWDIRVVDPDASVRALVQACVQQCPGVHDGGLLMALDHCSGDSVRGTYTHLAGLGDYLATEDLFGQPVIFYGWPHRILNAERIARSDTIADGSVEGHLLRALYRLHDNRSDPFLTVLPFKTLTWTSWKDKRLTKDDGRRILADGLMSSCKHELERIVRNRPSTDVPSDESVQGVADLIRCLERHCHLLSAEDVHTIQRALAHEGTIWADAVDRSSVLPVLGAIDEIARRWLTSEACIT